ncbi:unnamed protein product [Amoebophrya sp. A25]|nr:unnamed protein product [Amoebophrya sp. A25]|eukprot:GSA25T00005023001.1
MALTPKSTGMPGTPRGNASVTEFEHFRSFATCDRIFLNQLRDELEVRIFQPQMQIATEGELASDVFLIRRGQVRYSLNGQHIRTHTAGEVFGEMACLLNLRNVGTFVTEGICDIRVISQKLLLRALKAAVKRGLKLQDMPFVLDAKKRFKEARALYPRAGLKIEKEASSGDPTNSDTEGRSKRAAKRKERKERRARENQSGKDTSRSSRSPAASDSERGHHAGSGGGGQNTSSSSTGANNVTTSSGGGPTSDRKRLDELAKPHPRSQTGSANGTPRGGRTRSGSRVISNQTGGAGGASSGGNDSSGRPGGSSGRSGHGSSSSGNEQRRSPRATTPRRFEDNVMFFQPSTSAGAGGAGGGGNSSSNTGAGGGGAAGSTRGGGQMHHDGSGLEHHQVGEQQGLKTVLENPNQRPPPVTSSPPRSSNNSRQGSVQSSRRTSRGSVSSVMSQMSATKKHLSVPLVERKKKDKRGSGGGTTNQRSSSMNNVSTTTSTSGGTSSVSGAPGASGFSVVATANLTDRDRATSPKNLDSGRQAPPSPGSSSSLNKSSTPAGAASGSPRSLLQPQQTLARTSLSSPAAIAPTSSQHLHPTLLQNSLSPSPQRGNKNKLEIETALLSPSSASPSNASSVRQQVLESQMLAGQGGVEQQPPAAPPVPAPPPAATSAPPSSSSPITANSSSSPSSAKLSVPLTNSALEQLEKSSKNPVDIGASGQHQHFWANQYPLGRDVGAGGLPLQQGSPSSPAGELFPFVSDSERDGSNLQRPTREVMVDSCANSYYNYTDHSPRYDSSTTHARSGVFPMRYLQRRRYQESAATSSPTMEQSPLGGSGGGGELGSGGSGVNGGSRGGFPLGGGGGGATTSTMGGPGGTTLLGDYNSAGSGGAVPGQNTGSYSMSSASPRSRHGKNHTATSSTSYITKEKRRKLKSLRNKVQKRYKEDTNREIVLGDEDDRGAVSSRSSREPSGRSTLCPNSVNSSRYASTKTSREVSRRTSFDVFGASRKKVTEFSQMVAGKIGQQGAGGLGAVDSALGAIAAASGIVPGGGTTNLQQNPATSNIIPATSSSNTTTSTGPKYLSSATAESSRRTSLFIQEQMNFSLPSSHNSSYNSTRKSSVVAATPPARRQGSKHVQLQTVPVNKGGHSAHGRGRGVSRVERRREMRQMRMLVQQPESCRRLAEKWTLPGEHPVIRNLRTKRVIDPSRERESRSPVNVMLASTTSDTSGKRGTTTTAEQKKRALGVGGLAVTPASVLSDKQYLFKPLLAGSSAASSHNVVQHS